MQTRLAGRVRYGLLRGPLALLELPLFVLLPAFYGERLGLDLALIGAILFGTRLLDAVADPLIGAAIDRRRDPRRFRRAILLGLPFLVLGYALLFHPQATVSLGVWLALTSMLTYLAYSLVSIAYQAWGASLGSDDAERVRITATREGFGLLGVVIAASLLVPDQATSLVILFAASSAVAAIALWHAPLPKLAPAMDPSGPAEESTRPVGPGFRSPPPEQAATGSAFIASTWRTVRHCPGFGPLLGVFMMNGIASAIPASLVLFFVADVLQMPDAAPRFLLAYFLAAALGMPLWVRLADRMGLRKAWLAGMALSVIAFIWALALGPGDGAGFLAVCLITGFALGADLAVPPALLAAVISADQPSRTRAGSFFGLWNLATKVNLAAAAGVALPLLAGLGYTPGGQTNGTGWLSDTPGGPMLALSLTYAALPCLLKTWAALALIRLRIQEP